MDAEKAVVDWTHGSAPERARRERAAGYPVECAQPNWLGAPPPRPEPQGFLQQWSCGVHPCCGDEVLLSTVKREVWGGTPHERATDRSSSHLRLHDRSQEGRVVH